MLAISLGVYEKALNAIGNFFNDPIKNFKFLFPLGLGAVLAIILTSKLLLFLLNSYYVIVMLFFLGLIAGGIVPIFKEINIKNLKISDYIAIFLSFIFVILLSFVDSNTFINITNPIVEKLIYFFIGTIDAATMIIPGISGTAVMMLLGVYDLLLNLLGSINDVLSNLSLYIPYGLGIVITIISLSKIMSYLFDKRSELMYSGILGFSLSSILILLIDLFGNYNIKIYQLLLFVLGIYVSSKLEKIS